MCYAVHSTLSQELMRQELLRSAQHNSASTTVESNQAKPRELVPGGIWPAAGARKKGRYFS
jgi:hypothetical protein